MVQVITRVSLVSVMLAGVAGAAEPILLFNGESLEGWTTADGKPVTAAAWEVVDGQLHLNRKLGRGGHLFSQRVVEGDFELHFDWKIAKGGNSGLKYRVRPYGRLQLGCEYQLLDDANHRNGRNRLTSAGALYGLVAPAEEKALAPLDEFNRSRVVVRGQRLEHWLNDRLVMSVEVGSEDWQARIRRSKFSDKPGFGENRAGRIMIQDHGSEIWFRSIALIQPPAAAARH